MAGGTLGGMANGATWMAKQLLLRPLLVHLPLPAFIMPQRLLRQAALAHRLPAMSVPQRLRLQQAQLRHAQPSLSALPQLLPLQHQRALRMRCELGSLLLRVLRPLQRPPVLQKFKRLLRLLQLPQEPRLALLGSGF